MDDSAEIAKLARAIERSRTISLIAQAALVVAAIPLLAVLIGKIGFEPVPVISVVIALGIGIAFLAWHRRRLGLLAAVLKATEAHKAELKQSRGAWRQGHEGASGVDGTRACRDIAAPHQWRCQSSATMVGKTRAGAPSAMEPSSSSTLLLRVACASYQGHHCLDPTRSVGGVAGSFADLGTASITAAQARLVGLIPPPPPRTPTLPASSATTGRAPKCVRCSRCRFRS